MSVITLPLDSSTVTLNGRIYNAFVTGDNATLTPVNPDTARQNAARGGVTIIKREDRGVHTLLLRLQRFTDDDIELNSLLNASAPVLISGSIKTVFVKDGTDGVETYSLENGSATTKPTAVQNDQDGNQLMEYTIEFRNVVRTL